MIGIILPTNKCNQSCSYCHTLRGSDCMSDKTLKNSINFLTNLFEYSGQFGHIEWHAAEPTLMPISFYEKAEDYFDTIGFPFERTMCTNLTLINNDWIQFFKKYKYSISTSLDGDKFIHNHNRNNFDIVIKNLKLINDNNIKVGIISVISKYSAEHAKEIYPFFHFIGQDVQLNLEYPCNFQKLATAAFIRIFDDWYQYPDIQVTPFAKMINFLASKQYDGLCHRECHNGIVAIDPLGNVYPCECFVSPLSSKYIFGNVNDNTTFEILNNKLRLWFLEEQSRFDKRCLNCKYLPYCGGGCMWEYLISGQKLTGRFGYSSCYVLQKLFKHIEEKISDEF